MGVMDYLEHLVWLVHKDQQVLLVHKDQQVLLVRV
jgi:hypothetical protein